jgi:acyl-coenzyme A thioesterase PaaI-like protein
VSNCTNIGPMAESRPLPDLEHFQSIPWCAALLSAPGFKHTETFSRTVKAHNEDTLFGQTLKSDNTISHAHSVYLASATKTPAPILEVRTLVTLSTGMNGGPNALHGGMITTLMDDAMGTLLKLNRDAEVRGRAAFGVTAKINVRFRKLMLTPGTYCVGARVSKVDGKKVRLEGWVRDQDNDICVTSESLWILVKRSEAQMKL